MDMIKILIILFCVLIGGCDSAESMEKYRKQAAESKADAVHIAEIDGCEYLIYSFINQGGICHKGNCKNPVHNKN